MTTPWDRISDDFRSFLHSLGFAADSYNAPSFDKAHWHKKCLELHGTPPPGGIDGVDDEETPGSKANPSRSALASLAEAIAESGFTTQWCGDGVGSARDLQSKIQDSEVNQDISGLFRDRLGISLEGIDGAGLKDLDFLKLRAETENTHSKKVTCKKTSSISNPPTPWIFLPRPRMAPFSSQRPKF
ncbi:expressed unknown protein [Seminavis robusta]|uniref:Uncharacterized protein n=1 Tax=Seminavis robusta TaxID=568900 RepID=A0A9N8HCL9_9STRA|nr:expressed unknown protein [Seminavis robusta]|eukprot:Sro417_g138670.1 n/a (186) ;mRNA; f:23125-23682